jgi:hypothetical protein
MDITDVKALIFDVFGTVVDWHSSIIQHGQQFGRVHGVEVDWAAFADAWRARYRPGSVTKRLLCLPVQSTSECKTRGEERWHGEPRVAIQRCGPRQAWQAGAGMWTSRSLGAPLCFLPSARGAADVHNSPPLPGHDAVPCTCEAAA